jgi:hypothetical protein
MGSHIPQTKTAIPSARSRLCHRNSFAERSQKGPGAKNADASAQESGASLADRSGTVTIYSADRKTPTELNEPERVFGEGPVTGFVIELKQIYAQLQNAGVPIIDYDARGGISRVARSHLPKFAPASYVLWRKSCNAALGDAALRTSSYMRMNSLIPV